MSLTPELLASRASKSLLLPQNVPDSYIMEMVNVLVFTHGEEKVMKVIDELLDLFDTEEPYNISENTFSYSGVFEDAATSFVHDIEMKEFTTESIPLPDVQSLFKKSTKQAIEIPKGYMVMDYRKEPGQAQFLIARIDGDDPLWVLAPQGRPDLAVEQYMLIKELDDTPISEIYRDILETGYEIPENAEPTKDVPEPEDFDEEVAKFKKALVGSRWVRDLYPRASRGMTSMDGSNEGTYWKFKPILETIRLNVEADGDVINNILLLGTGRVGTTGMCAAVYKNFPKGKVVVYDPNAIDAFPEGWEVYPEPFRPDGKEKTELKIKPDIIVSDVAIGDGAQFDEDYSDKFARGLVQRFKGTCHIVYKNDVGKLVKRSATKVFFGRGHNAEMFVYLSKKPPWRFISADEAKDVIKKKRRCDLARNLTHVEGVVVKRKTPIIVIEPVPSRHGNRLAKPWSHHRKYNTGLSVSEYSTILANFDTSQMVNDDPVKALIDTIRKFAFMMPDVNFNDLVPDNRGLFLEIRKVFDKSAVNHKKIRDRMGKLHNKGPGQRKSDKKKRDERRREYNNKYRE